MAQKDRHKDNIVYNVEQHPGVDVCMLTRRSTASFYYPAKTLYVNWGYKKRSSLHIVIRGEAGNTEDPLRFLVSIYNEFNGERFQTEIPFVDFLSDIYDIIKKHCVE